MVVGDVVFFGLMLPPDKYDVITPLWLFLDAPIACRLSPVSVFVWRTTSITDAVALIIKYEQKCPPLYIRVLIALSYSPNQVI